MLSTWRLQAAAVVCHISMYVELMIGSRFHSVLLISRRLIDFLSSQACRGMAFC